MKYTPRLALVCAVIEACTRSSRPDVVVQREASAPPIAPFDSTTRPAVLVGRGTDITLPPPYHTPSAENPARIVERPAGATLRGPTGTTVDLWASGLTGVRAIALSPDGRVFASDHQGNRVLVLHDADGDGRAELRSVFARNLNQPFGLAFHPADWLYVANTDGLVRFRYSPAQREAGAPERVTTLPGNGYNQHWTRSVAVSPDARRLYVTVGSETNNDVEEDPRRAAVSACDLDGANFGVFAGGLRNPVALAFHPDTAVLFAVVNERDTLGDDLVPDYLTSVRAGAFYGWPYSYFGQHVDPNHRGRRPDLVARAVVPDLSLGAHVAAVGLVFPVRGALGVSRGDALVSLHGSWNRSQRVGYKVVRARFANGAPTGEVEDFVTGWTTPEGDVWGRPVGLLELTDGSVLVVDDGSSSIWRVHR